MSWGDRFFLFLVSIALGVVGIAVMASMLGALQNLQSLLTDLYSGARWETVTVAAVVVASSMYLLSIALKTPGERSIVSETSLGSVKISQKTVESLVFKAAGQIKGVRDIQPSVSISDIGLKIGVDVTVAPDAKIPEMAVEIQERVSEHISNTVGITVSNVQVNVRGLSSEGKARVG